MYKKSRKLLATVITCLLTVMLLGVTALADDYKITITNGANDTATHVYEAYQIFAGDVYNATSGKVLSNITWGSGVDGAAFLSFLQGSSAYNTVITSSVTTATQVAKTLEDGTFPGGAEKFADAVSAFLTNPNASGASVLDLSVSGAGYYFIKDKNGSLAGQESAAYTDFMLQVLGDVSITAKAEVPTLDKKIVEGGAEVEANTAAIGDKIDYKITSYVPDMTGYEKYFFVVEDTLSDGLTFNGDVAIQIEGYTGTVGYTVNVSGQKFTIAFNDFINYKTLAGNKITITYSATLNESAVVGGVGGNPNSAQLIYSNNPNVTPSSSSNVPGSGDPVGVTPTIRTVTYTTSVELTKVDGNDTSVKLAGAKFTISGEATKVTKINGQIFEEDSVSGTYYMLKDGTFSTTVPTAATGDPNTKYSLVSVVDKDTDVTPINASAYTNATGNIVFTGLGDGQFTLVEDEAPEGYNLLTAPINVVITATPSLTGCTWSVVGTGAIVDGDVIKIQVENNMGIQIPETGGIGTVLFYLIGACMIGLAITLFITKRRVRNKEN